MMDDPYPLLHLPEVMTNFARQLPAAFLLASGMLSAQTLATPRLRCEIAQTAASTTLTATTKGSVEPVVFRIDWTAGQAEAEGFLSSPSKNGVITSTHRLGQTTITRTILADETADCIVIHVIADQPGEISLDAKFVSEHPAVILNRREILLRGEKTHAHAWILPFEADVHDDGRGTVSLNGEGEALIILNLTADPEAVPISDTLLRLGRKHDPKHMPPDPHRVWEGVKPRSETPHIP